MENNDDAQLYGPPPSPNSDETPSSVPSSLEPQEVAGLTPPASTIPNLSQSLDEPESPTAVPNPYPTETNTTFYRRYPELEPRRSEVSEGAVRASDEVSNTGVEATSQSVLPGDHNLAPRQVLPGDHNPAPQPVSAGPMGEPGSNPDFSRPDTTPPPTPQVGTSTTPQVSTSPISQSARPTGEYAESTSRPNPSTPAPGGVTQTAPPSRPRPAKTRWFPILLVTILVAALISAGTVVGMRYFLKDSFNPAVAPVQPGPVTPPSGDSANLADWVAVAEAVRPAVVAIQASGGGTGNAGSGVIFDDQAHIITNHHVIAGADADKIEVFLVDGRVYSATLVGSDPTTDLAVLQINNAPDGLGKANLGTSANLRVGQPVAAIGNPLQLASTMTTGIISALDRPVTVQSRTPYATSDPVITNAIQVDASINPGNSGGPLFDATGTVIGINSSITTTSSQPNSPGGSIGLGFAIPVDLVKSVTQQLLENGKVEHAFIGVFLGDGTAEVDGVRYTGAYLRQIVPGSAAEKAGLKEGEVVLTIDGAKVTSGESLTGYVRRHRPGDTVTLEVGGPGGKRQVEVVLGTHPEL